MPNPVRHSRKLLPAIAAAAIAAAAAGPPAASAATPPTVWLNDGTGVLSFTGTATNDAAAVSKLPAPGGSVISVRVGNLDAANFSANCTEGGGIGDWVVTCPAANVQKLTFDGGPLHDSFTNNTNLPSVAHGGPGIDYFRGGAGPDVLAGDGDSDNLTGNGGDDTLDGGSGLDTVAGGDGNDLASWADASGSVTASLDGAANDGVGGEGENVPGDVEGLQGGAYADKLSGTGVGPDRLLGGDGPDELEGWSGDDVLRGEGGDDTLSANSGADVLDGGADSDSLSYASVGASVYVAQNGVADDGMAGEHDNVTAIERLTGSTYPDDLDGTEGDDVISGGDGFDKISPRFGDDTVDGGDGGDNISGGPGMPADCGNLGCTKFDTDTIDGGRGSDSVDYSPRSDDLTIALNGSSPSGGFMENDVLSSVEGAVGGAGNDTIYGSIAANSLTGGPGGDGITGGRGNDYISGDVGNDFVDGAGNDDFVVGGGDNDVITGVGGNDHLYGGSGRDRVTYDSAATGVVARIGVGTSGPAGESDVISGDVEDLDGSFHADRLYGNATANTLNGYGAKDLLVGNGGPDTLQGGSGPDTLNTKGDGAADQSACGTGADIAHADLADGVDADCERAYKG